MKRDKEREGSSAGDAAEDESTSARPCNRVEEASLFLSDDGEARRRFLKQTLLAGGGLAAANLLLHYQTTASAQTRAAAVTSAAQTSQASSAGAMPVTLRVNGRGSPLQIAP